MKTVKLLKDNVELGKYAQFFANANNTREGELRVTSASANHICNLAKETVKVLESTNISFIDENLQTLGPNKSNNPVKKGISIEMLDTDIQNLEVIGNLKALQAWLKEAIKAKSALTDYVKTNANPYNYGKVFERPEADMSWQDDLRVVTGDDYLSTLSTHDRCEYYILQAKVANLGKFIHPDGQFAKARKEAINRADNPTEMYSTQHSDYLRVFSLSCDFALMDSMYLKLQDEYRELSAKLNKFDHDMETWVFNENTRINNERSAKIKGDMSANAELRELADAWQMVLLKYIQDLKIVVPKSLEKAYQFVNKR